MKTMKTRKLEFGRKLLTFSFSLSNRMALVLATFTLYLFPAFGQSPQKISYQAVIRNSNNALVVNTNIGMQISILQGSANGTAVYVERQFPTTNANGLVSIEIGSGTVVSGNFATIDWANGPYFIKTEIDLNGGANYTISGTSQLLSVPYALHAKTAENITGTITETDPVFGASVASGITGADTAKWNHKLDTETDPRVPAGTQVGQIQYWNGTAWVTLAPPSAKGSILYYVDNQLKWIPVMGANDVINPTTGKIWMDRNLGASQVATSSTDAAAYGYLYQWGRASDGHQLRTSGTIATLSNSDNPPHGYFILTNASPNDWRSPQNDNLWQGVSGKNNPCPGGYRLPTKAEWEAEVNTWSSQDATGAFNSPLKLPLAGYRDFDDGSLSLVGSYGYYWSSTVDGTDSRYLIFNSNFVAISVSERARGFSVRCIKD